MLWGLLGALTSAFCFGFGSVLQAAAARRTRDDGGGIDPRVLVRVLRQWRFIAGLGLDLLGFLTQLAALHVLPLFVVQAVISASLAVTAVVASRLLGLVLGVREWAAVAVICAGLALLGASAGEEQPRPASLGLRFTLIGLVAVLGVLGAVAGRLPTAYRTPLLGLLAGLGFGTVAVSSRVLPGFTPVELIHNPAAYAVPLAGLVAFLFYTSALQRGAVTVATAMMVLGQTVAPALVGIVLLGDRTRPGCAGIAIVGFTAAVAGALALARFGELEPTSS